MADTTPDIDADLQIDRICRRFDRQWAVPGQRPSIRSFLDGASPADQSQLLSELIRVEWERREDLGERPTVAEYVRRFPEHEAMILGLEAGGLSEASGVGVPDLEMSGGISSGSSWSSVSGSTSAGLPTIGESLPARIGDFVLQRVLGQGASGTVCEAIQESVGRRVACKILTSTSGISDVHRGRFFREARAVGRLHHPHIIDVYDAGYADGYFYLSMRLVDGVSLKELLARTANASRPDERTAVSVGDVEPTAVGTETAIGQSDAWLSSTAERISFAARLGLQLAGALQHASERGVLHRDIKPSNILVDGQGNANLGDFGLARTRDEADDLTATGEVVGTLRYLAPESIDGLADHRSDIYGLGITLYETVLLRRAFEGSDRGDLLRRIMSASPPAPSRVDPAIPADFETIVLRCIARDPGDRYASAGQLADDLGRFLAGKPIAARPLNVLEQFHRWMRDNRSLAASLLSIMALLLCLVVASTYATIRVNRAKEVAEGLTARERVARRAETRARMEQEAARKQYESELVRSLIHQARAHRMSQECGSIASAKTVLNRASSLPSHVEYLPELRSEFVAAHATMGIELLGVWDSEPSTWGLDFSPDGSHVVSASFTHPIRRWRVAGATLQNDMALAYDPVPASERTRFRANSILPRVQYDSEGTILGLMWNGPPRRAVDVDSDGLTIDGHDWLQVDAADPDRHVAKSFALAADARRMAVSWAPRDGLSPCTIDVFDLDSGERIQSFQKSQLYIHEPLALSPDGRWIAWQYDQTAVAIGRLDAGPLPSPETTRFVTAHRSRRLRFSPDGRRLAIAAHRAIHLIGLPGGPEREIHCHEGPVNDLAFSADGDLLVSAGDDAAICLVDASSGRIVRRTSPPGFNYVTSVALSPDGSRIVAAHDQVAMYKVEPARFADRLEMPFQVHELLQLAFDASGSILAVLPGGLPSGVFSNACCVRENGQWRQIQLITPGSGSSLATHVEFDPSSQRLLFSRSTSVLDPVPSDFEVQSIALDAPYSDRVTLATMSNPMFTAVHSADGRFVVARDQLGEIRVNDRKTGEVWDAAAPRGSDRILPRIRVTEDGRAAFFVVRDNAIGRLDLSTRQLVESPAFAGSIADLRLSQDGRHLLVALEDRVAAMDVDDVTRIQAKFLPEGGRQLVVAPQSGVIAIAQNDHAISFYSPDGQLLIELPSFPARINGMCFSPDEKDFYVYGATADVLVWHVEEILAALDARSLGFECE